MQTANKGIQVSNVISYENSDENHNKISQHISRVVRMWSHQTLRALLGRVGGGTQNGTAL